LTRKSLKLSEEHTDEGASGRTPNKEVEEGRGESELGALCRGNAGVADLDISHALTERKKGKEGKDEEKRRAESIGGHFASRLDRNWELRVNVLEMRSGSSLETGG
jgi:hypothetical protein